MNIIVIKKDLLNWQNHLLALMVARMELVLENQKNLQIAKNYTVRTFGVQLMIIGY